MPNEDKSSLAESLEFHWFHSKILSRLLQLWIAKPPTYSSAGARYPFAVFLVDSSQPAPSAITSQWLIQQYEKTLPPMLVVYVEAPYIPSHPLFNCFLVTELWPWLQLHFTASIDPRQIAITGCHINAIKALYAALRAPKMLRHIIGISPDLLWSAPQNRIAWIRNCFASSPPIPLNICLYLSQEDLSRQNDEWHAFCSLLTEKKYLFCSQIQRSESHCEFNCKSFLHGLQIFVRAI